MVIAKPKTMFLSINYFSDLITIFPRISRVSLRIVVGFKWALGAILKFSIGNHHYGHTSY